MERESVDDSRSKEPRPGREKWSGPSGELTWIRDKGREKAKKFPQVEVRKGPLGGWLRSQSWSRVEAQTQPRGLESWG
jgi:hypothetical protein